MRNTIAAAAIFSTCALAGQNARFETVSVSPSHSHSTGYSAHVEGKPGQTVKLTLDNVTLKFCIQQAYGAKEYQVIGPGWIESARYDITGTMAPGTAVKQIWAALQALLADRFQLALRREQKETLLYAMTVAPDGPKMHAASGGGPEKLGFQPGAVPPIRRRSTSKSSESLRLNNASVAKLCDQLSRIANHPVVDRTGLNGTYDFDVQLRGTSSAAISKVLGKQLGLRVDPAKDMVEMMVVERASRKPVKQ